MAIRTIENIDVSGKKVLIRVDFNVPIANGLITDDTRMRSALPTLRHLLDRGAALVIMSHMGRPKGQKNIQYSMKQLQDHLAELTNAEVIMAPDVIGPEVEKLAITLRSGQILLLENTRFYSQETENETNFCRSLARLGDIYVNDAFGAAHRAHASTEGVTKFLPSYAGLLMEKECSFLDKVLKNPVKPFVAVIGGAKVSSKIAVLESLLDKADAFIIGGGMAYTFLKEQGKTVGKSLVENEYADTARSFLDNAARRGVTVLLPYDHIVADEFSESSKPELIDGENIPAGKIAMDIGPKTISAMKKLIENAETVVWNGPMGVFEFDAFSQGTLELAKTVADCPGMTVLGGGDSVAAVNKFNLSERVDHVSTGGGASLEYLEGRVLPGIAALNEE